MLEIPIHIPSLLHNCTRGQSAVTVTADTVAGAIDALLRDYPLLRTNLFEPSGAQRKFVLIFYNEENIHWLESLDIPLQPGDRLTVLQSVAGG